MKRYKEKNGNIGQNNHYYPFGLTMGFSDNHGIQPYKFGSKELDRTNGLDFYDFEARSYDPVLMRFMRPDPLGEKYYSISPYAYCGNNPVNAIDPDGREISFTYQWEKDKKGEYVINENGGRNLIGITMNVIGKVINVSSNSKVDMNSVVERISSQIESSFKGEENGVTFSTNVDLKVAKSMDDVAESDHVFALADFKNPKQGGTLQGHASSLNGKVAFIDADLFTGVFDKKNNIGPGNAAHEFGHLAGLQHGSGLMQENPGGVFSMWSTKINTSQLKNIHILYKNGLLNQGPNWEYKIGNIGKKMPYRGGAKPFVKY